MLRRTWIGLALGFACMIAAPASAQAALAQNDVPIVRTTAGRNFVEARQYSLADARVATDQSTRQTITAWEVSSGMWDGENLGGLSLVLVNSESDATSGATATNCYVSHVATAAQRTALVAAYLSAQAIRPSETTDWRIEPAVIKFEVAGRTVILHLGLIA